MQKVAREMNLPKITFFVPSGNCFHLRWFALKAEVNLCGRATL